MAKQQMMVKKNKAKKPQHVFNNIRDVVVADASNGASPNIYQLVSDPSGNGTLGLSLSPFGYQTVTGTASSATGPLNFASTQSIAPVLPWLYNQARNFEGYRVTNATLIIVGNVGSTATGRISVVSSRDYVDYGVNHGIALAVGGITFDISTLSTKERRFPLDVDSSWKICSSRTAAILSGGQAFVPVNSVNDLLFTNFDIDVAGASASTILATFNVEYTVEFRGPISYGANA